MALDKWVASVINIPPIPEWSCEPIFYSLSVARVVVRRLILQMFSWCHLRLIYKLALHRHIAVVARVFKKKSCTVCPCFSLLSMIIYKKQKLNLFIRAFLFVCTLIGGQLSSIMRGS